MGRKRKNNKKTDDDYWESTYLEDQAETDTDGKYSSMVDVTPSDNDEDEDLEVTNTDDPINEDDLLDDDSDISIVGDDEYDDEEEEEEEGDDDDNPWLSDLEDGEELDYTVAELEFVINTSLRWFKSVEDVSDLPVTKTALIEEIGKLYSFAPRIVPLAVLVEQLVHLKILTVQEDITSDDESAYDTDEEEEDDDTDETDEHPELTDRSKTDQQEESDTFTKRAFKHMKGRLHMEVSKTALALQKNHNHLRFSPKFKKLCSSDKTRRNVDQLHAVTAYVTSQLLDSLVKEVTVVPKNTHRTLHLIRRYSLCMFQVPPADVVATLEDEEYISFADSKIAKGNKVVYEEKIFNQAPEKKSIPLVARLFIMFIVFCFLLSFILKFF